MSGADDLSSSWEGLRVVRGPDWRWAMQDGGEGFVGTIVSLNVDERFGEFIKKLNSRDKFSKAVIVVWDCGTAGYYRVGYKGAYDLRLVDNAATGVIHDLTCGECCRGSIEGFRWFCVKCETHLCSSCYFNNVHENKDPEAHCGSLEYWRFVTPNCEPVVVWKDLTANKVELKGIFNEARVKRGRDWDSGEEDTSGNVSGVGKVVPSTTLGPGWVQVKWPSNNAFPYRIGAEGKVDLRLEKHASGGHYQTDHLPVLNFNESTQSREIQFAVGDSVKVNVDAETLKHLQSGHGGWVSDLKCVVGETGIVRNANEVKVHVDFQNLGKSWFINPIALVRLGPFSVGQPVRVKSNQETTKSVATKKIVGATGSVLKCLNDFEVEVVLNGDEKRKVVHKLQASALEILPVNKIVHNKVNKAKKKLVKLFVEAASEGQTSVLEDLLSTRFLNVNDKGNKKGQNALHLSSRRGHVDTVEWLLEHGANVEQKDNKNRSAIHHAAKGCQPDVLAILIRGNGALIDVKDKKSLTPLQLATKAGCVKCIHILIMNGCNMFITDNIGDTALHNAIFMEAKYPIYRDHEIVDKLIENTLDFDFTNSLGLNAILLAATFGNIRVLRNLLKSGRLGDSLHREDKNNRFTVLHTLCFSGDYRGVKMLVNHATEADIHALLQRRCKHGLTPLLLAAFKGNYSIVEYLISSKENRRDIRADVTAKDDDGDTAVHHVAAALDELRAIPNEKDSPEIFKIFKDLTSRYPGIVTNYPGLSLMCYLIRHGCPWKRTSYRKALAVIKNEMFRDILIQFCPHGEEDGIINGLAFCPLCETRNAEPGTFEDCNHTANVCSLCALQFPRCLECLMPNRAFKRNQTDSPIKFEETDKTKNISSSLGRALNAQIASGDGYGRADKHTDPTQKAIAEPQPSTSNLDNENYSSYKDGPEENVLNEYS